MYALKEHVMFSENASFLETHIFYGVLLMVCLIQPPSNYTKEEFHNNVLPRVAENQPPRILNELRQLSCRLVASGIAKGLLTEDDLPQTRRILISRFQVGNGKVVTGRFCSGCCPRSSPPMMYHDRPL